MGHIRQSKKTKQNLTYSNINWAQYKTSNKQVEQLGRRGQAEQMTIRKRYRTHKTKRTIEQREQTYQRGKRKIEEIGQI